ncbi:MAG: thiolase family protein [Opitutae bacterium]|nr:thiolase family protein [Opitutae bacterium]
MKAPLYIVDGVRTPFAKMGTTLAACDAAELGRTVTAALLARTGLDPAIIDEVVFGCVGNPVDAANVARVIALRAGIPEAVPAITVSRNCASGFEAITQASDKAANGRGDIFVVGGAESMSNYPLIYNEGAVKKFAALGKAKSLGQKLGAFAAFRPKDLFAPKIALMLGLTDPVCGLGMGQTTELLARDFGLSREAQDEFALRSHQKAEAARAKFKEEITPVYPRKGKEAAAVDADNGIREGQTMDALGKLKAVFEKRGGTVTAGNASQVTDGAAALLVATEAGVKRLGLTPLGKLVGFAYAGCEPARMGLGPVYAIAKAEKLTGLTLADADLIEINEAFAAQVMACCAAAASDDYARKHLGRDRALGVVPPEKFNVNGGAVALGHPVGASGARLVLTALKELKRRNAKRAVVSLCIGGGQGGALWVEVV